MPLNKRPANVPPAVAAVADDLSKSDLLEALWDLSGLCNEAGSVDDDASSLARLVAAVNANRAKPYSLASKLTRVRRCGYCKGKGLVSVGSFRAGTKTEPCPHCAPACEAVYQRTTESPRVTRSCVLPKGHAGDHTHEDREDRFYGSRRRVAIASLLESAIEAQQSDASAIGDAQRRAK